MINFLLGFSISINLCLVVFLVFVFKKQESKIYEKFDADVFFPKIDKDKWKIENIDEIKEHNGIKFQFKKYSKI